MSRSKRGKTKALRQAAMQEQTKGKIAICPNCNAWFSSWQERNIHRGKCPKRRKA